MAPEHTPAEAAPSATDTSPGRSLVTGARGFVGRHLVAALQAAGDTVHGLDVPAGAGTHDPDWLQHHRRLGEGSAGAADGLATLLADGSYAAVYHLAGQSSAAASFADPAGTIRANLLGALEILEAMRLLAAAGHPAPRLLLVGSAEEYGGAATAERPCRETDPVLPLSPYATSKAAATQLGLQYHRSFGIPVLVARSFNHTGPGQDARFVFPSFAAQIAACEAGRQRPVLRTGDLSPVRDFLDVRDVVAAYRALIVRGRPGRIYNVCSGSPLTIGEGLQILLGLSRIEVRLEQDAARLRPVEVPYLVGDPATLRRGTGWQARYTLQETMRDLLQDARRRCP
jgi:GDP-4-dehydro-6-deoxy-D-mannose reductase